MRILQALIVVVLIFALGMFCYLIFAGSDNVLSKTRVVEVSGEKFGVIYPQKLTERSPLIFYYPASKKPVLVKFDNAESGKSGFALRGANILLTSLNAGGVYFLNGLSGDLRAFRSEWDHTVLEDDNKLIALASACCADINADTE